LLLSKAGSFFQSCFRRRVIVKNRVAVAVIHGMGSQGNGKQDIEKISYSSGLYKALKQRMGDEVFTNVAGR
jgi:hypothetical protein